MTSVAEAVLIGGAAGGITGFVVVVSIWLLAPWIGERKARHDARARHARR